MVNKRKTQFHGFTAAFICIQNGITTFSPKPTKINYPSNGKADLTELGKRKPHSSGWKISIKCTD